MRFGQVRVIDGHIPEHSDGLVEALLRLQRVTEIEMQRNTLGSIASARRMAASASSNRLNPKSASAQLTCAGTKPGISSAFFPCLRGKNVIM
jgi:hypothetical protein